jgi:hypothetical protein
VRATLLKKSSQQHDPRAALLVEDISGPGWSRGHPDELRGSGALLDTVPTGGKSDTAI